MNSLTDLMKAVLSIDGDVEKVRTLIAAGSAVNATIEGGLTALHVAAMADWREDEDGRMQALLKAGANTEIKARSVAWAGWTPLMVAAAEGRAGQVQRLLEWGATSSTPDDFGKTALMLAAGQPRDTYEKVKLLLDFGADRQRKCFAGWSALDYAKQCIGALRNEASAQQLHAQIMQQVRAHAITMLKAFPAEEVERHLEKAAEDLCREGDKTLTDCQRAFALLES